MNVDIHTTDASSGVMSCQLEHNFSGVQQVREPCSG